MPYEKNLGDLATPATDGIKTKFTRSSSLDNVRHNERPIGGFNGNGEIKTPATDGLKPSNVKNGMPKP